MNGIVIFGASNTGKREYNNIEDKNRVACFVDNDKRKWNTFFCGKKVYEPSEEIFEKIQFEEIIVASVQGYEDIKKQLLDFKVPDYKIKKYKQDISCMPFFLNNLKQLFDAEKIIGSIAEVGVFQGNTAAIINEVFYDRTLFLFDTFEGFTSKDVEIEQENGFSDAMVGQYSSTSVQLVISKMKNPEKIIIKKGFFPESAYDVDEKFCFVRLDLDLYQPTKEALKFFHNKMVPGSIIIVHDYFGEAYLGIKRVVDDYISQYDNLHISPMGDRFSIIITGY